MHTTLNNIATLKSGHTFREKITESLSGAVHVLQIKDIRRHHTELLQSELQADTLARIQWEGNQRGLLSPGGVLLPMRGEYYKAVLFNGPAKVVASSQLLVISVTTAKVLPAWLCWALNQNTAQHYLESESKGSNISSLSRHSAGLLPLQVPSLATQHKIIALQQLWEQEQQLTRQLLQNRETLLQGMFQQLMAEKVKVNGDTT